MGLITLNGSNPFAGQADPFIGFEISYEKVEQDGEDCGTAGAEEKTAIYNVDLNGTLTGCSFGSLTEERERVKQSFTPTNVTSFVVDGLNLPTDNVEVRVNNINFSDSNYIGFIPYSIGLTIAKKLDEESLVTSKTHSLSFDIPAQGENTVRYAIGANGLETGDCQGLQRALDWVSGNSLVGENGKGAGLLQWNGIGEVLNPDQTLILVSEGETLNRAENSYQRSYSYRAGKDGVAEVYHDYSVTESEAGGGGCPNPELSKSYRGNFSFRSSTNEEEVEGDRRKLYNAFYQYYDGIFSTRSRPFNVNYNSGDNTLDYSMNSEEGQAADGQVVYDESLSTSIPEGGVKSYSVNGTAWVEGGPQADRKTVLDNISNGDIIGRMKSLAGESLQTESTSIDRDAMNGGISYNGRFVPNTANTPDVLDGVQGLTSYRIDMTCPLEGFSTVYVLGADCDQLVLDSDVISRAAVTITANGASGAKGLGVTEEAIKANLKSYVEDKKNQLASSPEREKAEIPRFSVTPDGCASYTQGFSWNSKNSATSVDSPAAIESNLLG